MISICFHYDGRLINYFEQMNRLEELIVSARQGKSVRERLQLEAEAAPPQSLEKGLSELQALIWQNVQQANLQPSTRQQLHQGLMEVNQLLLP